MEKKPYQLHRDTPATYRICIQGVLPQMWSDYLDDMLISLTYNADASPVTVLTGRLIDQAALIGVLNNVYDLGYPLLSVVCLNCGKDKAENSTLSHGRMD